MLQLKIIPHPPHIPYYIVSIPWKDFLRPLGLHAFNTLSTLPLLFYSHTHSLSDWASPLGNLGLPP